MKNLWNQNTMHNFSIMSLYSDIHQTFLLILPHSVCHHNNVKAAARLIQYALFTLWRQNTINLCKEEERGLSTEFKSFLLWRRNNSGNWFIFLCIFHENMSCENSKYTNQFHEIFFRPLTCSKLLPLLYNRIFPSLLRITDILFRTLLKSRIHNSS